MAFNEETAHRISEHLKVFPHEFVQKKMFGGIAYLYKGKMTVGVLKDDLTVRILFEKYPDVFDWPNVRPMDFTSKAMKDFIYVSEEGFDTEEKLMKWIEYGLEHAESKV